MRIDITVPGAEIAVSRDSGLDHAHEAVCIAMSDAFNAAAGSWKAACGGHSARRSTTKHRRTAGSANTIRSWAME